VFDLRNFIVRGLVYIDPNCQFARAAKLLCASSQIILPVVNECLEPVGILTEKDILAGLCNGIDRNTKAAECMQTKFTVISENIGLIDIVRIFASENYKQIMVVCEGVLVGLVNRTAIIKYLLDEKSAAGRQLNAMTGKM
jgi:predicted transcriptional regulator